MLKSCILRLHQILILDTIFAFNTQIWQLQKSILSNVSSLHHLNVRFLFPDLGMTELLFPPFINLLSSKLYALNPLDLGGVRLGLPGFLPPLPLPPRPV